MSDQSKFFEASPLPILVRPKKDYLIPPKCPLEHIKFIQLFQKIPRTAEIDLKEDLGFGFDLVDASVRQK